MTEPLVDRLVTRWSWLDPIAEFLQAWIGLSYRSLGRPGESLKSLLHGSRGLGHPLHPALTDVPVGAWTVAVVADYAAHFTTRIPTEAGDIALAVGLVGALGSAVTGFTDFHETYGHERRVAVSHGLGMTVSLLLMAASMALRWWAGAGLHPWAVGLATAGLVVLFVFAYLGGHVVYAIGTTVNHLAFTEGPREFVPIGSPDDFPAGLMRRVEAAGMGVLVVRSEGVLYAIAETCSHAGGPLHEGGLDGCVVTCPWHGSRFRVDSGKVLRGPATFPQPTFSVREEGGTVSVRLGPPVNARPSLMVGG